MIIHKLKGKINFCDGLVIKILVIKKQECNNSIILKRILLRIILSSA